MNQQEATLVVAVLAAVVSLLSLALTSRAARATEARAARRALLASTFTEIGSLLYELVALSKKMTQARNDETFEKTRNKGELTAQKIDELRRKTRYALWGIDDGFRTILWMPAYIGHNKKNRESENTAKIIKLGTLLRVSIDAAIMKSYETGSPPTIFHRLIVWHKAQRLRQRFADGKPDKA